MSSILIVGKPGSGKTHSLGTLPGSLFVAEFDATGDRAIRREPQFFEPGDASQIAEVELPDNGLAVIRYLTVAKTITKEYRLDSRQLNQKRILDLFTLDMNILLNSEKHPSNIAVDSLTGLSRIAKGAIFSQSGPKGSTFKDWDIFAEKVLEVIEVSNSHENLNFVMTAHIATEKDAVTEAIEERVFADGQKIPRTVIQAFDIMYQSVYRDGQYLWRTKPTETFQSIRNRLIDGDDVEEYIPQNFGKLLAVLPKKR